MAKLYISEFERMGNDGNGAVSQVAYAPEVATQVVTYTTTTQSNAFASRTRFIRVHTDSICSISIGADPTATTSTARMAADQTEYFAVVGGHKIAAVTNT